MWMKWEINFFVLDSIHVLLTCLLTYLLSYLLNYLFTYLLTPWSGTLPEKLTGFQLVKKFRAFYWNRRFITVFTSDGHLSLSWARTIQSIPPHHFLKNHLNIILPSMPTACKYFLALRFPHPNPVYIIPPPHTCYMPSISFFSVSSTEYLEGNTDH